MSEKATSDKPVSPMDEAAAMGGVPVGSPAPAAAPAGKTNGEAPKAGPDLTIQDLQALKSIIDVASQRGAFKPNEMVAVGQTYQKLEDFLAAVAAQQAQQPQPQPQGA
jgi:hypothetical protein